MKRTALFVAFVISVGVAMSVAVVRFRSGSWAVKELVSPGALSARHAYLGGRCEACHDPTVGVTAAKCIACHANEERLLGSQPTAFHASVQECAACHVEHQHTKVRPLTMDHLLLAQVGARTLQGAAATDADSAATRQSLNRWLRLQASEELDESAAHQSLNCAGCHDREEPHLKRFGADCAQCHQFDLWSVAGFQHPSPQSTTCMQCHLAPPCHFMGHFTMVCQKLAGKENAKVEQCFECHHTASWNDIVGVGFIKAH